jgi:hypothetical protein
MCPVLGARCTDSVRLETGRVEFYSPPSGGFVPLDITWFVRRSA